MAIYRGAGGAGDAVADSSSEALLVRQLAVQTQASADAAATSATSASTSATNAATSATNAATSASSASTSASTATTQATNASTSASAASTSATAAASSATAAASSASSASTSATTATTQASNASTSASAASTSATNAANSATSASTQATNAAASASAASTSATNAASSATSASGSASGAATSATSASTSASNAASSSTSAGTSASTATTQAGIATTQASNASSSASAASTSATNASNSATSASTSASTATTQATNASNSASAASTSASNAATSATNAANSATTAASYTPSQTGNAGKFLTTNGTSTSWGTPTAGTGTVTSVAATVPSFLSVSGSPITTAGTLAISYSGTALPVANGGTGVTTSTGSGANVLGTSPTITTPTIDKINTSVLNTSLGAGNATLMKNRLINGACVIDQRNNGASVATTTTNSYTYSLDRWAYLVTQTSKFTIQQNAGSITPPEGFTNYLGCTSTGAYSVVSGDVFSINQLIEGFNTADLGWGTANAKTVTLSFQVYSSLTGTFGGAVHNSGKSRNYPFTFSIPVANTWTTIAVTIAGDTSGTWLTNNGLGIGVIFGLGVGSTYSGTAGSWSATNYWSATGAVSVVGTSGATFYVTGIMFEPGSSATGYEHVTYQTSLSNCQRYYEYGSGHSRLPTAIGNTQIVDIPLSFHVTKRAAPTMVASGQSYYNANTGTFYSITVDNFCLRWTMGGTDNVTDFTTNYTAAAEL